MRFNGMVQFYSRIVPHASLLMLPLFTAVAGKKGTDLVDWSQSVKQAFVDIKAALAAATLLHHPHHDAVTALTIDASDKGVGAVLEQCIKGRWQPLAFFSQKFSAAEKNYSAFDRELLTHRLDIFTISWKAYYSPCTQITNPSTLL